MPPAPRYTITDLGTLPGGDHSGAYGINNQEQIAGWSDNGGDNDVDPTHGALIHNHAVVWDKGKLLDLGLLRGFPFSAAKAINNKGQVVGGIDVLYYPGGGGGPAGLRQTFLWQRGRRTVFSNDQPPSFLDELTAINDKGEAVGDGFPKNVYPRHPLLWVNGKGTDLGLLPGCDEGVANGINNKGEIVGWVLGEGAKQNVYYRAFLYRNGRMIDISNLPFDQGDPTVNFVQAFAINNKDQIVGSVNFRAALWENGKWRVLGYLTDYRQVSAYAINNNGQVVGTGESGLYQKSHAFVYQNSTFSDLNDLLPTGSGWVLRTGRGINDRGQIVGSGQHDGKDRAYLLTPVKEP